MASFLTLLKRKYFFIMKKSGLPTLFLLVGASQYEPFAFFASFWTKRSSDFDEKAHFINSQCLFKNLASEQKNIKWQKKGWFVPEKVCQYTKQWSSLQLVIQSCLFLNN